MVVEDQRRALGEVELLGEGEAELLGGDGDLCEPAEAAERHHARAGPQARLLGRDADDARDLAARHEGRSGFSW